MFHSQVGYAGVTPTRVWKKSEYVNRPTHTLIKASSVLQMELTAVPITFIQLTLTSSQKENTGAEGPPAEQVYRQVGKCHEEMSVDTRVVKNPKMCSPEKQHLVSLPGTE